MSTTLIQPAVFFTVLYGGILIGIVYDFFRLFRRIFCNRFVDALCDGAFVVVGLCIAVFTFLLANDGALRLYTYAALAIGFFVQQWTLSRLFFRLWYWLAARLHKN